MSVCFEELLRLAGLHLTSELVMTCVHCGELLR